MEACDKFYDMAVEACYNVYAFVRYRMDEFDDNNVLVEVIAESSIVRLDFVSVVLNEL